MNPSRPEATHVAVRDGRILGVGPLDELTGWGPHTLDTRFADKVLMPGLVEGHCHVSEGTLWRYLYLGRFDRMDPDGKVWPGAASVEEVVARLQAGNAAMGASAGPLSGWGLDPIYYGERRVTRQDFDKVSTTRAIGVMHASGHIFNVNSHALELAGLLRPGINHPGVPLGADGLPTGELKGPDAMTLVGNHIGFDREVLANDEPGLRQFARLCVRQGVTTATDLANLLPALIVSVQLSHLPTRPSRQLDVDVHTSREVELHQRVHRLLRRLDDVEQSQVRATLELFPGLLVDVRPAKHRPTTDLGRQREGPPNLNTSPTRGFHNFVGRLVEQLVIVGLQPDPDLVAGVHEPSARPSFVCALTRPRKFGS